MLTSDKFAFFRLALDKLYFRKSAKLYGVELRITKRLTSVKLALLKSGMIFLLAFRHLFQDFA